MLLMPLTISRRGFVCLWEYGGGCTNTGSAQIITDADGKPKRAIFVSTHGDLCNGNHALIPVNIGDKIVTADTERDKTFLGVFEIVAIRDGKAVCDICTEPIAESAIVAALLKARDYHCREPYYIQGD